jgi:hypothetical protein
VPRKPNSDGLYDHICRRCDTPYEGTHFSKWCNRCRAISDTLSHPGTFECVRDPDESGAFRGGFLTGTAVQYSLQDGSLPAGSVWRRNKDRKLFVVVGNEGWIDGQELKRQHFRELPEEQGGSRGLLPQEG